MTLTKPICTIHQLETISPGDPIFMFNRGAATRGQRKRMGEANYIPPGGFPVPQGALQGEIDDSRRRGYEVIDLDAMLAALNAAQQLAEHEVEQRGCEDAVYPVRAGRVLELILAARHPGVTVTVDTGAPRTGSPLTMAEYAKAGGPPEHKIAHGDISRELAELKTEGRVAELYYQGEPIADEIKRRQAELYTFTELQDAEKSEHMRDFEKRLDAAFPKLTNE